MMTKYRTLFLLISLSIFAVTRAWATPPDGYDFLTYQEGMQQANENKKPVFIYVGRYGCGFCDRTNKESFSNPEVKKLYEETFNLVYMDSDGGRRITLTSGETLTEMQFAERMNILGTPVFITIDTVSRKSNRHYGYHTDEQLLEIIESL